MIDKKQDLIIKLAKLANSNNAEGEANSAARRVCKLLEEMNWNSGWDTARRSNPVQEKPFQQNPVYQQRPDPPFYHESWNHPPTGDASKGFADFINEMFGGGRGGGKTDTFRAEVERNRREREKQQREREADEWNRKSENARQYSPDPPNKYEYYMDENGQQKRKIKSNFKHVLKCTQCGSNTETGFIGNPAMFICTLCQWNIYQKAKGVSET